MLRNSSENPYKKFSRDQRSHNLAVPNKYRTIETTDGRKVQIPEKVPISRDQIIWFELRSNLDRLPGEKGNRSEWTGDWTGLPLEWHHFKSRFFLICQGASPLIYNHFNNIIGITDEEHDRIHPTDADISDLYAYDRNEYKRRLREVHTRVLAGEENWDTQYDEELQEIIMERSQRLIKKVPYPQSDGTKLTWSDCRRLF